MLSKKKSYQSTLSNAGLRVTPQRIAVLEVLYDIKIHPSAEEVSDIIRENHPNIATGTIYNVLETFVKTGIVSRVKTDKGVMLYDTVSETHHHIFNNDNDNIIDYRDAELDHLLENYFKKKKIKDFQIEEIKLNISGTYKHNKK